MAGYIFLFFGTIAAIALSSAEEWEQKIIPLRTDRASVEKLLGEPKLPECSECTYETPLSVVNVNYAVEKCKGSSPGWNVPRGTVLSFTVSPKTRSTVNEAGFKAKGLKLLGSHDGTRKHFDLKRGIDHYVNQYGELQSVTHYPVDSDNELRCAGFPPYRFSGTIYRPDEVFESININEGIARIENSLIILRRELGDSRSKMKDIKLYVVIYSGDNLRKKEFHQYLDKLRSKFEKGKERPSPDMLEIINGGRKKRFEVDLFFVKKDDPPPSSSPEFPS